MAKEQQCAAKGQMIALMQVGRTFQEAATMAGVQISRSAAYRLLRRVRTHMEKPVCKMADMNALPHCGNP